MLGAVRSLAERLRAAGIRAEVDDRTDTPFGRRAVDWELKGVPLRIEIGPRDLADGTAMLARRVPGGKEPVPAEALPALLPAVLEEGQAALLRESRSRRESATSEVATVEEAVEAAVAGGWARIAWSALGPAGGGPARGARGVRTVPGGRGRVGARLGRRARYCRPGGTRLLTPHPAAPGARHPGVRWAAYAPGVRVATYHLGASCETSPQFCAPARVGTHQGQLTGTCKLFGMARNRNTGALVLVVTT